MKTKFYFLLAIMGQIGYTALAQDDVLQGRLLDEKDTPVAYANVAVIQVSDSALATGVVSESSGKFAIPTPAPGTYFLRISAIGFADQRIEKSNLILQIIA